MLSRAIETGTCQNSKVIEAFAEIVKSGPLVCPDKKRSSSPSVLETPAKTQQPASSKRNRDRSRPQQIYIPPALRRSQRNSQMAFNAKSDEPNRQTVDEAQNDKSFTTDEDDDCWDKKFNDDGDPRDADTMRELEKALGQIKIVKPNVINYLEFSPSLNAQYEIKDEDEQANILELYDFPTEFRTHDLNAFFVSSGRDLEISWVDDNHALALFSTASAARYALQNTKDGIIKRRPLSQASAKSKLKAKDIVALPAKARPQTSSLTAKRLVSSALGIRIPISKEEREKEKLQLKEAKEKRRLEKQQKKDAWEDD